MMRRQIELGGSSKFLAQLVAVLALYLLAVSRAQAQGAAPVEHPQRRLVVSLSHKKLAVVENGEVKKVYPVAVGANVSPSPTGSYKVINRLEKPTYYHKGKVIGPGKTNPLGTRWMGLSAKGYGIHGTNDEKSIGKAASHGCIRMHKADLEELFATVQVGDEVVIAGDDNGEVAAIFGETTNSAATTASGN